MRNAYEVRHTPQGFAVRPAARPRTRGVAQARPRFFALDLGRAVRLVLALLLYILQLRLDSQMLSHKRAQQVREDIVRLVQQLTTRDPQAQAEAAPTPVVPIAAARPISVKPQSPAAAGVPASAAATASPLPRPFVRRLPDAAANSAALENMSQESLGALSLGELREFVRVAARDTKPMFEQALLAVYRKQLMAMFFGPFSVKQETDDFNYPDFLLICRGAQTILLRRTPRSAAATAPDAYEMLREYWSAQKKPKHFRVEQ